MPTLIITRGLPASGKSTRARAWVSEDPQHRLRVNRDDLRAMGHESVFVPQSDNEPGTERAVQAVRDAAISAALKRGVSVVSDDTNLPTRVARDLRRLAVVAAADFEVWDLTDVPLDECLRRNALRSGHARVPDDRVVDMHRRFIAGKPHPLPLPDEAVDAAGDIVPYVAELAAATAIMVDLDGTAALMSDRSPFDESRVGEDRPNRAVVEAVRAFHAAGHEVIYCSGRTEGCREATEKWLAEHIGVPYIGLYMRASGDIRKDAIVKRELFDAHIRKLWDILAVLDDRTQVVEMWRSLGLTVFQVAPGDF